MKIIVNRFKIMTLEEFADLHGLVMEVNERDVKLEDNKNKGRFYARFQSCEVARNACLFGVSGEGHDVQSAILDYVDQIVGRKIVFDAMSSTKRKEIQVPVLVYEPNETGMNGRLLDPPNRPSIAELSRLVGAAGYLLKIILSELPGSRDWLNPDYEKSARNLLKEIERYYIDGKQ